MIQIPILGIFHHKLQIKTLAQWQLPKNYVNTDWKTYSGSENLSFSTKSHENCQELALGRFIALKNEILHKMTFWGFLLYLSRDCPATTELILLQRPHPGRINPVIAACRETENRIKSFNPHFKTHLHPMTLKNYSLTLRSVSKIISGQIRFRKVVRVLYCLTYLLKWSNS